MYTCLLNKIANYSKDKPLNICNMMYVKYKMDILKCNGQEGTLYSVAT